MQKDVEIRPFNKKTKQNKKKKRCAGTCYYLGGGSPDLSDAVGKKFGFPMIIGKEKSGILNPYRVSTGDLTQSTLTIIQEGEH